MTARILLVRRLVLPALAAAFAALAAFPAAARAAPPRYVDGEVIVKFRQDAAPPRRSAAIASHAHVAIADLHGGWVHVRIRPGETVEEAIAGYVEDPEVEWVQPNYVYRASAVPNDPVYAADYEWALHNTGRTIDGAYAQASAGICPAPGCSSAANGGVADDDIGAEAAWDVVTDCTAVTVAVIDTGVNYRHQDLAGNMWTDQAGAHGYDFIAGDTDPMDENGHGTHVAGIIGARGNDGVGAVGVCWSVRLMALRALDATGSGTTVSLTSAVDFARTHGANVVNLSLGGNGYDALFSQAIDAAVSAGALVVVAAGNEASNNEVTPSYPCNFANAGIVCVAALDQAYQLADFSNYGQRSVDVGAPGVNVVATWPGTTTSVDDTFTSGWSFSPASGSGWGTRAVTVNGAAVTLLTDPPRYDGQSTTYVTPADHRVWKTFDASGADVFTLEGGAAIDVSSGDHLRTRCATTTGDPFASASSVLLEDDTNLHTGGLVAIGLDLSPCMGTTTTVGFQLQSALPTSTQDLGVAFIPFTLNKLRWNTTSYNTLSGTSMATPVVAGVAALVKAYQPAFTPADLVGALTGGGVPVAALATTTKSGNAVSAIGALRYVNPPRGLTFSVQ